MKTRLLIIIGFVMVGFVLPSAFACACIESTPEQRIENAQVIFSGKLVGDVSEHSALHISANFAVKKVWKGAESFPQIKTGNVSVVTGKDDGVCGVKFIAGKDYLIFAQIDGDTLVTSTCDGSWFLDGRQDDVKALDAIGSTHAFLDARETIPTPIDCKGPGLTSEEQCEFDSIVRQIFLPLAITLPIVGVAVFVIWRKRKQ